MCFIADSTPTGSGARTRSAPCSVEVARRPSRGRRRAPLPAARGSPSAWAVIHCTSNAPRTTVDCVPVMRVSHADLHGLCGRAAPGPVAVLIRGVPAPRSAGDGEHIDLRRPLPRVIRTLGLTRISAATIAGGGDRRQRQVRAVAPSPQGEPLVAQRPPDVRHVVGALARVVGLEPDAVRARDLRRRFRLTSSTAAATPPRRRGDRAAGRSAPRSRGSARTCRCRAGRCR